MIHFSHSPIIYTTHFQNFKAHQTTTPILFDDSIMLLISPFHGICKPFVHEYASSQPKSPSNGVKKSKSVGSSFSIFTSSSFKKKFIPSSSSFFTGYVDARAKSISVVLAKVSAN